MCVSPPPLIFPHKPKSKLAHVHADTLFFSPPSCALSLSLSVAAVPCAGFCVGRTDDSDADSSLVRQQSLQPIHTRHSRCQVHVSVSRSWQCCRCTGAQHPSLLGALVRLWNRPVPGRCGLNTTCGGQSRPLPKLPRLRVTISGTQFNHNGRGAEREVEREVERVVERG